MKTSSKFVFSMLTALIVLAMLFGAGPVDSVKAEAAQSPLAASGDFVWAKGIGAGETDGIASYGVVTDSNNNIYLMGGFNGTIDFDPGPGVFEVTDSGIYICKFNDQDNFDWVKVINVYGAGYDIAIDSNNNIYITGNFEGTTDFDPSPGVYNLAAIGTMNVFVVKFDSKGNLIWAKNMGVFDPMTPGGSWGIGVAVNSSGDVYTVGGFAGTVDFNPGAGVFNLMSVDDTTDVFVSRLDKNGNFLWAGSWGGNVGINLQDEITDIVLDSSGNIYTAGLFGGTVDFDPGPGVYTLTAGNGEYGSFISKLTGSGSFVWAKADMGWGLLGVDATNNLYLKDTFDISRLDGSGNLIWKKSIAAEGIGVVAINDMVVVSNGNTYTTGYFSGTVDFDPGAGEFKLTSNGTYYDDIFIFKLDANGNFVWAKQMGGGNSDYGEYISLDKDSNIITTGIFWGTADFDPGDGVFNLTPEGRYGMFISKLEGNIPSTFGDVPYSHPLHDYIEALYDAGYTAGCSTDPMMFCPDTILDRAQSAVFMLRGQMGSGYTPPAAPWNTFVNESWVGFEWAQPWAEGMYQEGLTQGCQSSPLMYCPATQLPRVEASVFGLRMKYGVNYTPPAATGTLFADFPSTDPSYWGIDWAEQAYNDGLLPACGTDSATGKPMFCPSELVDRGWGAYLIVKAKNLPLP